MIVPQPCISRQRRAEELELAWRNQSETAIRIEMERRIAAWEYRRMARRARGKPPTLVARRAS